MALSDATRLADFSSTVPSFGNINAIGVVTATGGMDGIGIHSGGNVIHSGIITALNFVGTGNTFAINGTTVDISISGAGGTDNINTGTAATFSSSVSIANSIFHVGDDNTHFGFPDADTFVLSTGGVQRLNISQTVNVTPEDNQTDAFSVKQGSNEYITVDTTNSSERITIGNVTTNPEVVILSNTGIGTTNPEKPLHVFSATGDSMTRFESGDATIQLELKDNAGSAAIGAVGNEFRILTSGGGGDEALRIQSDGRVAVGHTQGTTSGASNNALFNVIGNVGSATGEGQLNLWRNSAPTADDVLGQINLCGGTDGAPGAVIQAEAELDWDQGGDTSDHPSRLVIKTVPDNSSVATERLRITSGGDVGIGTDEPTDPVNSDNSAKLAVGIVTARQYFGDGSNLSGISVGLTTEAVAISAAIGTIDMTAAQDHRVTCTGICTINATNGTEADSHTIRIVNSGIATVGFSTYFLFPSGAAPDLPTADGAISLISFTVNRVGVAGTQLLAGASLNYS